MLQQRGDESSSGSGRGRLKVTFSSACEIFLQTVRLCPEMALVEGDTSGTSNYMYVTTIVLSCQSNLLKMHTQFFYVYKMYML